MHPPFSALHALFVAVAVIRRSGIAGAQRAKTLAALAGFLEEYPRVVFEFEQGKLVSVPHVGHLVNEPRQGRHAPGLGHPPGVRNMENVLTGYKLVCVGFDLPHAVNVTHVIPNTQTRLVKLDAHADGLVRFQFRGGADP